MMKNIIILLASVLLFSACSTKKEIKPIPIKNISFESYLHTLGYKQNDIKHFTKQLPYDDCSKAYSQDLKALDKYVEINIGPAWSKEFYWAFKDNKIYIIGGKCCKLQEDDKLLFSLKTVSSYRNDTCKLSIEKYSEEESNVKVAKIFEVQKQRDAEYKKKQLQKALKERQEEQRYYNLRNRKGEYVMQFFDESITHVDRYNRLFDKKMQVQLCKKQCIDFTKNSTGYINMQSALSDGWKFVTKLDDAKYDDKSCSCRGQKVILKK